MAKINRGFGLLFWINSIAFGLYALFLFSPILQASVVGKHLYSFTALFVAFFLVGQNILAIIEATTRKHLLILEKFPVIVVIALFATPLTVTLAANTATDWLRFIPIFLAGITSCIAVWLRPFFWEDTPQESYSLHLLPAGLLATTLFFTLLFHLTTAYYALPDLDPYYWLQKFRDEYAGNYVTSIQLYRPLFSSLGYIFFQTASIDLYAYFKYLLPSFALLILIPAALVANRMQRFSDALLVFLFPLVSGSFILYSVASIPQAISNLTFLYGIYLIAYAFIAHRPLFSFLAGTVFFLSILYHEMAVLFFAPWLAATVFTYRKEIRDFIQKNTLATILVFVLIASHLLPTLFGIGGYFLFWIERLYENIINFQPNFSFPATYVNVDGNAVGWGDWPGVIRYYAFYLGPLAGVGLLALGWYFRQKQAPILIAIERPAAERTAIRFLFTLLALFILLGEILPRLFNFAFLPERAMGFFGGTIIAFLMIALSDSTRRPWSNLVSFFLITATLINAGAALYINGEKQFLITPNQISSAEWIRNSLPTDRIILTNDHWNLIRFHSQTESTVRVDDPLFYRDIEVFESIQKNIPNEFELHRRSFETLTDRLNTSVTRLRSLDPVTDRDRVFEDLTFIDSLVLTFITSRYPNDPPKEEHGTSKIFIYYGKPSDRNPYANRPYMTVEETVPRGEHPVFDRYPDRFERVYALPEDEVVIWKLIQ